MKPKSVISAYPIIIRRRVWSIYEPTPVAYAKNVLQSSILYFTPATVYSLAVEPSRENKILRSSVFLQRDSFCRGQTGKKDPANHFCISQNASVSICIFYFDSDMHTNKSMSPWNLFILLTIGFVFGVSSLFEHYENMRFRFETEPFFLILAAQVFS